LGISVFPASLSTVVLPMMNDRVRHLLMGGRRKMSRKNHYILVGTGGLAANVFAELNDRNLPVTLIVNRRIEEPPWNAVDQVVGDPADTQVLKEAGILDARALLSLLENDGENAFVVLAARASGTEAKTVVSVRDRVNLARIRTVRPDMILAMDVIGAQILGMALSGEPVDGDQLLKKVLFAGDDDPEKVTEGS
jgi:voltage-gated potassium channel